MRSDVIIGHDGKPRCAWAGAGDTALGRYHDEVWGTRTYDESAIELEALRVDGDRAVTRVRASFVIAGVAVEHTASQAARFSGGRFVWWARFESDEDAGEAVGLPPGAGVEVRLAR